MDTTQTDTSKKQKKNGQSEKSDPPEKDTAAAAPESKPVEASDIEDEGEREQSATEEPKTAQIAQSGSIDVPDEDIADAPFVAEDVAYDSELPSHNPETPAKAGRGLTLLMTLLFVVAAAYAGILFMSNKRMEHKYESALTHLHGQVENAEQQRNTLQTDLTAAQQLANEQAEALKGHTQLLSILSDPATTHIPLVTTAGAKHAGSLLLNVWRKTGIVVADGLEPVADHQYQVWIARDETPVSVGSLMPDASGKAQLVVGPELIGDSRPTRMWVSIEPSGDAENPSGTVVLSGKI